MQQTSRFQAMAGALLSAIVKQLGPFISSEFALTASVEKEVQKLETKFRTIQAVLNDAEKRQLKEEAVKLWLDKLKRVSYEMDDVLDEWNTAMIKEEIEKQQKDEEKAETSTPKKRKVWPLISVPNHFQHRDIAHKIKELNEKLDEINKEREMYGFEFSSAIEDVVERPKTTCYVDVSDINSWLRVAKAIVEALGVRDFNTTELQSLLEKICELIGGKKFFLVFDDVWTEDYALWKPFKDALKNCASQSSRILVITRKGKVAKMMESANTIKLEELFDKDYWLVFSKIAFFDKDPKQCEQLEVLGKQISKKCKGLPLTAKTLESLLHFKKSKEEWKNILDSYFDLPSPLKQCFSYCAVFPKVHDFNVNELNFRLLRVFTLKCSMELLHTLENLIHLRYLDLLWRNEVLPETIYNLCNLQYLKITQASDSVFTKLPQGIGSSEIRGLGNVVDVSEAENAQIKKKIHLREMNLSFKKGKDRGPRGDWVPNVFVPDDRRMERDALVLNALEPSQDLELLNIRWHQGTTMSPNWLMSLTKLKTVSINWPQS
ncbi:hypothetical protein SO802_013962 [Lithocarpus litseifolius]|uniref:Uncharacterized protein n=1 Tax=Lithocarpus litseifolius TaxID=425828 RepID=A0AAW2D7R9_9ROSI